MEATNLHSLSSEAAPREWALIPEIADAKPKIKNVEISLQRLDGTDICVWEVKRGVYWNSVGDFFIVKP